MQQYFQPDLSNLREVPEAERLRLLDLAPQQEPARNLPDLQVVEQLLQMIRFARSCKAVPAPL
jgi:hypothetical protein